MTEEEFKKYLEETVHMLPEKCLSEYGKGYVDAFVDMRKYILDKEKTLSAATDKV
jgi:hypothetical protein